MPDQTAASSSSRGNSKYTYMELLSEWKLIDNDQDWKDEAICTGVDYDVFFPAVGYNQHDIHARTICNKCPVKQPCLMFAVNNRIQYGIWGGLTPIQRKRIRPTKWETR